ncbi:MAG: RNA polymerase-associated protein RapA [Verrucomicrobiae bacterium]|nr:RNA polymerase-associated protein RapA [Verrucomicrobiae bacterium]
MNAKLRAAANQFLQFHSRNARQRGEEYFHAGRVQPAAWTEDFSRLDATVTGTQVYQVTLRFMKGAWDGECSCPVEFRCKHGVAAMLTLLELAGEVPADKPGQQLAEKLGRSPTGEEAGFLRQVGMLFRRVASYGRMTGYDLRQLAPSLRNDPYLPVKLWDKPPRDEIEFWQYLAYYFDQNHAEFPAFLRPLCDHARIAPIIRQLQREEEIQRWSALIQNHLAAIPSRSVGITDARARLVKKKFLLEICTAGSSDFRPIKRARFSELVDAVASGEVELPAAAAGVWRAFCDRWNGYESSELNLQDDNDAPGLRLLLTQPGMRERVVNEAGQPFDYPAEPLRWEVTVPADAAADYRFRLVLPAGAEVLGVIPGAVPLYLTPTAVWRGPQPLPGNLAQAEVAIPAPAVETTEGVRLLTALGGELPARLRDRVRRVAHRLQVTAELRVAYGGIEHVLIQVAAGVGAGKVEQVYTPAGWSRQGQFGRKPAGVIEVVDESALAAGRAVVDVLGAGWNNPEQCWQIRVTKSFPEKFTAWLAGLPAGSELKLDPQLATLREGPVAARVRLECEPSGVDWFDLRVVLDVADTKLTKAELRMLLNARGGFVRLGAKGWRRLQFNLTGEDDAALARLGLAPGEFTAEPQRLHALQLADKAAARFLPEAQVAAVRRRAEEIVTRLAPAVPTEVRGELRPYQLEGFHFLAYLSANRFGGILADDMGLGKTLQALTWLAWLRSQPGNAERPVLVVCPKSVMDNWRVEAERFVPGLRVQLGTAKKAAETDLVVVNYTQLRALGTSGSWLAVILDEGQYIKNPDSLTAKAGRALKAEYRLVLTGTPIENRLLDLWSLLAFAMPGVLGTRAQFVKQFDAGDDPLARQRLAARVRPFLLRRTKAQVANDLPARVEEDLLCEMEGVQATLYRAELKHAQQMLLQVKTRQEFDAQRFNFLTSLLRLRQICCHPALVDAKRAEAGSAKVEALLDVLEPLMEEGHKVLVFSQFVGLLELLRPVIEAKGWKQFWLTGATEERGDLVREFQGTEGAAVFLISLKAGGFGLNLTAASYVVLFDPWWNPAVEAQAIDRTHRIGQTRHVMAYRLLIKGSIEEKIRALQKQKRAVAEDILGEERFTQSLTVEDLRFLFADG